MFHYLKALVAASRVVSLNTPIAGDIPVLNITNHDNQAVIRLPLNADTAPEGPVSIFWESRKGHVIAEPLNCTEPEYRDYRVIKCYRALPKVGQKVWVSGWLGESVEDFNFGNSNIVKLKNGTEAVQLLAKGGRWVILIHGRKATYAETLRIAGFLHSKEINVLAISHESDPRPKGLAKRRSNLGRSEWQQVEQAVNYALSKGASEVVLYGFSLGCVFISEYLRQSRLKNSVTKVIYDSPLIDFESTLRLQAQLAGESLEFGSYVFKVLEKSRLLALLGLRRSQIPDLLHGSSVPMLVLYSQLDGYVSMSRMEALIDLNKDSIFINFPGARHCRLYNQEVSKYQTALLDFLS
ncbi:MAG: hypothetical protein RIQ88_602 [Actinomycetota bacterium]